MDSQPPPISGAAFEDLTERVRSRNCLAFVGAGMSTDSYPNWEQLVAQICSGCDVPFETTGDPSQRGRDMRRLAQLCRDTRRSEYFDVIRAAFPVKDPSVAYQRLAAVRFPMYLTTNFDLLLEQACYIVSQQQIEYSEYPNLPEYNAQPDGEIVYLHGRLDPMTPDIEPSLVLADDDFENAYSDGLLPSYLTQTFTWKSVVFIGCSIRDDSLQGVLRQCSRCRERLRAGGHQDLSRRFMLTDERESAPHLESLGITPVCYDSHARLSDIFDWWKGLARPRLRQQIAGGQLYATGERPPHE